MRSHKKKYRDQKVEIKALKRKIEEAKVRCEQDQAHIDQLSARTRVAQDALRQIEREIEHLIGKHAALLPMKVETMHDPWTDEMRAPARPIRKPLGIFDSEAVESLSIRDRVLHRLHFDEVQEAIDVVVFRLVDRGKNMQVTQKASLNYFMSKGALGVERVQAQVALDMSQVMVRRLLKC